MGLGVGAGAAGGAHDCALGAYDDAYAPLFVCRADDALSCGVLDTASKISLTVSTKEPISPPPLLKLPALRHWGYSEVYIRELDQVWCCGA